MPYELLRQGRISLIGNYYLLTTTTAHRRPLFHDPVAARCVINSMRSLDAAGHTQTLACMVMPDHLHWLMRLSGRLSLSEVMQRFKGRSARELNRSTQNSEPIWQKGFHDRAMRSEDALRTSARYLIENPLRAGLANRIGDYPWWYSVWEFWDDGSDCVG